MLNCTNRKSVERVLPSFFAKWPTAEKLVSADIKLVEVVVSSLGFKNRRTKNLLNMSKAYLNTFRHAKNLPGIGEYGSRAWEIFYLGKMGVESPRDHALTKYWIWRKLHDKEKICHNRAA